MCSTSTIIRHDNRTSRGLNTSREGGKTSRMNVCAHLSLRHAMHHSGGHIHHISRDYDRIASRRATSD